MGYSTTAPSSQMYLRWYVFVYAIQSNYWLYLILGIFFFSSPVNALLYHFIIVESTFLFICLWMLYPCFLRYVGVIYTIYSLVVIHLGNIANHIFCIWFVMLFSPYLFTHMHNSGLTSLFLISCHMHWNTYICSWFLNISYIYFSFKVFLCFLLLGQLLSLKLQHSKTSLKLWHSKTYI